MTSALAIETVGLRKTYGAQVALDGVDLAVPRGAAFGLIGPNGAGKTTFIKAMLGIVRPTGGSVRVLGADPEDVRARERIGYLPERLELPAAWNARAFLSSVAALKGLSNARAEIEALLTRVGLAADAHRRIGGYSKGMRQRLGLASALLGRPELLVLDEPTDGIDPLGRVEIRRILTEELARGATLFLNSHLLSETERVCGRIGILARGKLVREGALAELTRPSSSWRARFSAESSPQGLAAAGFTPEPGGSWRITADSEAALNAALDRARAQGALLVELTRDEQDLEQVLADALGVAA